MAVQDSVQAREKKMGSLTISKRGEGELMVTRDFRMMSKGEIAQFIAELQLSIKKLMVLYEEEA